MRTYHATPLDTPRAHHAEGPMWDDRTGELAWVDTYVGLVQVVPAGDAADGLRLGEPTAYQLGQPVGAVVPRVDPAEGWLVASELGFAELHRDGVLRVIAEPEAGAVPATRMNDGKCDPHGRFWAGSMGNGMEPGAGRLHVLNPDLDLAAALADVTISNGLAWFEPDAAYYIDTPTHRVDRLSVTPEGRVARRQVAFDIPADLGAPDGMTIDADGCLWVALWGGGRVARFSPAGEMLAVVEVPASQVSSCTFAGPGLDTLVVTTSQHGFTPADSAREPLAGRLFAARPGVRGLPADRFGAAAPTRADTRSA